MSLLDRAQSYVGRPYVPGEFDCGSLAVLVQREVFGRNVSLPHAGTRPLGRRGQAQIFERQTYADPIESPRTGCVVIFWQTVPGGVPPLNRLWHLGTVFVQAGETWVLHASNEAHGAILQRLPEMIRGGMHLDGFYAWN